MIKVNSHVKVRPTKPDGEPHPHAGKTGIVLEVMGVYLIGPGWPPKAQVKIDPGQDQAGNIMIVGLGSLEEIK